jgi:hypothetical protein
METMKRRFVTAILAALAVVTVSAPAQAVRIPGPPPPGNGDEHLVVTTLPAYCGVGSFFTLVTTTGRKNADTPGSAYALTVLWNDTTYEISPPPFTFIMPATGDTFMKKQWIYIGYGPARVEHLDRQPAPSMIAQHAYLETVTIIGYPPLPGEGGSPDLYNSALSGCDKP